MEEQIIAASGVYWVRSVGAPAPWRLSTSLDFDRLDDDLLRSRFLTAFRTAITEERDR